MQRALHTKYFTETNIKTHKKNPISYMRYLFKKRRNSKEKDGNE